MNRLGLLAVALFATCLLASHGCPLPAHHAGQVARWCAPSPAPVVEDCRDGHCDWRRHAQPSPKIEVDLVENSASVGESSPPLWVPLAIVAAVFVIGVGAWLASAVDG